MEATIRENLDKETESPKVKLLIQDLTVRQ